MSGEAEAGNAGEHPAPCLWQAEYGPGQTHVVVGEPQSSPNPNAAASDQMRSLCYALKTSGSGAETQRPAGPCQIRMQPWPLWPTVCPRDLGLYNLMAGGWDAEDFLIVEPGQRIEASNGESVLRAARCVDTVPAEEARA